MEEEGVEENDEVLHTLPHPKDKDDMVHNHGFCNGHDMDLHGEVCDDKNYVLDNVDDDKDLVLDMFCNEVEVLVHRSLYDELLDNVVWNIQILVCIHYEADDSHNDCILEDEAHNDDILEVEEEDIVEVEEEEEEEQDIEVGEMVDNDHALEDVHTVQYCI